MQNKDAVLLFPGGAREVCKRRSERYTLQWGPQPEFVRMAARLDALVVPFSLVGADDAFDVLLDPEEVLALPLLGSFLKGVYEQNNLSTATDVYPLTRLPGTPLPRSLLNPPLQYGCPHTAVYCTHVPGTVLVCCPDTALYSCSGTLQYCTVLLPWYSDMP